MTAIHDAAGLSTATDNTGDPVHAGADPGATLAPIVHAQRLSVLVVDDEPTVRLLITEVLDDMDYVSLEATDGPSGLQILRSDAPVDLMITDVGLPGGMDGRHNASKARSIRPGLAILFITGYAETAALGDGDLEPRTSVLTKPFSIDALTSCIKQLVSPEGQPSE